MATVYLKVLDFSDVQFQEEDDWSLLNKTPGMH